MIRRTIIRSFILVSSLASLLVFAGGGAAAERSYRRPEGVAAALQGIVQQYPQLAKLMVIGKSASGRELLVLRIAGPGRTDPHSRPAVFVSANLEGVHLPGTEAALTLIDTLCRKYPSDKSLAAFLERRTVYVAPLLNPDASAAYFSSILWERSANGRPVDDDVDGRADEDGPDDLNKDGIVTQMRFKDPEGRWIIDPKEPRLMRLADPKKGEKGVYKVMAEGLDNDGDGEYNEDPPGGVVLNRNFPHDFEYNTPSAGLWPVSEEESAALVRFLTGHPSIGLILNFGTENTILNQQQTGQARAGADRVKVPRQFAGFLGLDPEAEYTLKEIADHLNSMGFGRGMEIDEGMIASFLGLGPAVAIDRQDQPLWDAVQKEYKDGLKEAKIDFLEKRAKGVGKGAYVAYAYFQYGVPVFSVDLWAVPEPKKEPAKDALTQDKLKAMSADEFLALGEEKIAAFLKEQGAPPNFNAGMLMNMVKSGQVTPAKMAEMMDKMPKRPAAGGDGEENPEAYILNWSDTALQGKGFVKWTPVTHPALGDVEVGGFVPYLKIVPPPSDLDRTIAFHADFFIKLMTRLPDLVLKETRVEALASGLFRITAFVSNEGWFPTSTAQGRRALTAWPIRAKLIMGTGQSLFSGRPQETVPFLEGGGGAKKLEWTVKGKKGSRVTVSVWSPRLGVAETTVVLN